MQPQIPADARPISFEDLFAAIGELYVQVRVQRQIIAQQHQDMPTSNGLAKQEHEGAARANLP